MSEIETKQFNELLLYIENYHTTLKYLKIVLIAIKKKDNLYDVIGIKAEFLPEAIPMSKIILDIPEMIVYQSIKTMDKKEIRKFIMDIKNRRLLIDDFSFNLQNFKEFRGIRLKSHGGYISYFNYKTDWPYYLFKGDGTDTRVKNLINEDILNKNLNRQGYEDLIELSREFLDCSIGYDLPFEFYLIIPINILVNLQLADRRIIFTLKSHNSININDIEIVTNLKIKIGERLKIKFDQNDKISEEKNFIHYKKIETIPSEDISFVKIWVFYQNKEIDQNSIELLSKGNNEVKKGEIKEKLVKRDSELSVSILNNTIIDKLKKKTISLIKKENWVELNSLLEKEPKQLLFYSELIEKQIRSSQILEGELFKPIIYENSSNDINPKYYRFIPGIEFILKLIRANTKEFTPEFKNFLCDNLFSRLKDEIGYHSTLDLFLNAFHAEILDNYLERIIYFPHILDKVIKNHSDKVAHLFPSIISNKKYGLGFSLVIKQPELLEKYKPESLELVENIIIYEEQYTQFIQLLDKYNPNLKPALENARIQLKNLFYEKLINSQRDTIELDWFFKNANIFRYTLYMYSDDEFSTIIQKIIELDYAYSYEDNKTVWMHLLLLEIAWYRKVELFWGHLEDLVRLNHLQVVSSCFLQRPERIKQYQDFILENLGFFTIDLLERRYSAFNIPDPIQFFKRLVEKNKSYYNKVIKIFFENNEEFILDFKEILLSDLRNAPSHISIVDKFSYYHISGYLDYIYYYYPDFKPDIDEKLINKLFNLILNSSIHAKNLYYVHFLRDNFNTLNPQLQKKFLSQLVENECIPCIEYYLIKNIDFFSQNIETILLYQPRDESDSDTYIRPLEYIIRKKYAEERELVDKILEHIEKLTPSRRKAEIYLLLNKVDNSKKIYLKLIENSMIIPNSILYFLDYQLVEIESSIERKDTFNSREIQDLLAKIETVFNKFNSSDSRQREFNIKRSCLKARLELYNGFQFLQNFEYEQAQEAYLKSSLLFKNLSEIDDKNKYNIDLFKINYDISNMFYQNIPKLKSFLEKKDVISANDLIQKQIEKIPSFQIVSDFQLNRHIKNLKSIKFNQNSQEINQFKSESPINFCTTPPHIINKRILDENGLTFIEWDKDDNIIKLNALPLSKNLKKYILEVRFDDKEREFDFISEIEASDFFEEMSINALKFKAGISSYEIRLKVKTFADEGFINIILTENNICGFQVNVKVPVVLRDQEEEHRSLGKQSQNTEEFFNDINPYIIKRLVERFSQFNHLEGKKINEMRIQTWFRQFEKLEWMKFALEILEKVEFFDRYRLRMCFEELCKQHLQNINFVVSNLGSSRDSSSTMNNISADFLMESNPSIFLSDILDNKNPDDTSIVFFDDIIQSGKQAKTIFQEWFGMKKDLDEHHVEELKDDQKEIFKKFHLFIFFAYGFERGIQNLSNLLKELGFSNVSIIAYINDNNILFPKCFHPASGIFLNPEDSERAKEMCQFIGYQLFSDKKHWSENKKKINSLGYGDKQRLIVTFWNVPTTTLPILWKRGIYNNKTWEPLFLRRSKK